jgi:multiple RNA-binding domain-containing protein 1
VQVIEKGGKAKGTKLLVKNVPFEATKKELQELFGYVAAHRTMCPGRGPV